MKLNRQLVLLVLAALLPLVALSAVLGAMALRREQASMQQEALARVRLVAALTSRELDAQVAIVRAIAESPAFDVDGPINQPALAGLAERFIKRQPQWIGVTLSTPDGRRVLDVPALPERARTPQVIDLESHQRAVRLRTPTFGTLMVGERGQLGFAVLAPVVKDGVVRYVVSARLRPETISNILQVERLPAGWRAVVFDGSGRTVANTPAPQRPAPGAKASAPALEARERAMGGIYEGLDGAQQKTVTAYRVIPEYGWSAHVAIPRRLYQQPVIQAAWLVAGCSALGLLMAGAFLLLLSREAKLRSRESAAEERSRRMEALGRMTGGVAHDFNNVLMIVQGSAEMLKRRKEDPKRVESLADTVLAASRRGEALTRQLLAFARRSTHEPVAFRLQDRAGDLGGLLARSAGEGVATTLEFPAELWPLLADPAALELALINLVVNARDAMDAKGRLQVTASNATLHRVRAGDLDLEGEYVAIAVKDSGPGVPEADAPHVFEPFFTTKPTGKGTGLGLSQVYGFVRQSGGGVTLDSRPGEGAVFTLYLPRASAGPQAAEVRVPAEPAGPRARVLLVDDDPAVATVVGEMLTAVGHEVRFAESARAAVALIHSGERFDVALSDVLMPGGLDGRELALKLAELRPGLPVVLMTGYSDALTDPPPGVGPVLTKPFAADVVLAAIADALRRREATGKAAE